MVVYCILLKWRLSIYVRCVQTFYNEEISKNKKTYKITYQRTNKARGRNTKNVFRLQTVYFTTDMFFVRREMTVSI